MASRSSGPVGGTDKGWLAEGVDKLAPSIVAPVKPALANHHTLTKCSTKCPADAWRLMQGTISKLAQDRSVAAATVGCNDAATSAARCCRNSRDKINDKREEEER